MINTHYTFLSSRSWHKCKNLQQQLATVRTYLALNYYAQALPSSGPTRKCMTKMLHHKKYLYRLQIKNMYKTCRCTYKVKRQALCTQFMHCRVEKRFERAENDSNRETIKSRRPQSCTAFVTTCTLFSTELNTQLMANTVHVERFVCPLACLRYLWQHVLHTRMT